MPPSSTSSTTSSTTALAGLAARPALRWLLHLGGMALLLYAVTLAVLWWAQEKLLFQPTVLPANHRYSLPPEVHETWVDVPGARLNALHLKLPKPDGVVFFLHGNGGSLDNWFVNPEYYRRVNLDLYMIDYRGYGKSSGRISSEAQLHADVRAAWDRIAPQYAGKRRVIYGRSLGTGLAAELAAAVQPDLTVLVSPYVSMRELAQTHYPWVPGVLLRYPLHTDTALPRIQGRLLLVHGESDRLIPPEHSRRLQTLVPRAELMLLPQAAHNDVQEFPAYLDGLATALMQR